MVMNKIINQAMILAAGEGTRLRPLTVNSPKALLPVSNTPVIELQLSWLKKHGVSQVIVNLHHLGTRIKRHLGKGTRFNLNISYSPEKTLLGTAGGVKKQEANFNGTFVVVYGDVITDFNLRNMIKFHMDKQAIATLALTRIIDVRDIGVVKINDEAKILNFIEKPPADFKQDGYCNGGIYILEKEIFKYIPPETPCDFAYDIFPELVKQKLRVYGYVLENKYYLKDIGTHERYLQANRDVLSGMVRLHKFTHSLD